MIALRRTTSTILAIALLASLGTLLAEPASAAPPTAVDDQVTMFDGGIVEVDVLANDSDPDGDELAICRTGAVPEDAPYFVIASGDTLLVALFGGGDAPDVITVTYYACDFESLVPATLTINVKHLKPVEVTKLDKPGVLRVTNPNDKKVRFLWGSAHEKRADGRIGIAAHDSVFVRVHRHRIIWVAVVNRLGGIAGFGRIRDIELPRDDHGPATLRERGTRPAWPKGVQLLG